VCPRTALPSVRTGQRTRSNCPPTTRLSSPRVPYAMVAREAPPGPWHRRPSAPRMSYTSTSCWPAWRPPTTTPTPASVKPACRGAICPPALEAHAAGQRPARVVSLKARVGLRLGSRRRSILRRAAAYQHQPVGSSSARARPGVLICWWWTSRSSTAGRSPGLVVPRDAHHALRAPAVTAGPGAAVRRRPPIDAHRGVVPVPCASTRAPAHSQPGFRWLENSNTPPPGAARPRRPSSGGRRVGLRGRA